MARRDLKDLISYLKLQGIWFRFEGRWSVVLIPLQWLRLGYFVGAWPLIIVSMYHTGFRVSLNNIAFFVSAGIYVGLKTISYSALRGRTVHLVETLTRMLEKRSKPSELEVFDRYSTFIWKVKGFYDVIAFLYMISYHGLPLVYDILEGLFTDSREPFNFPHVFEGLVQGKERNVSHYLALIGNIIWCVLMITYGLGSITFLCVIVTYCCIELRILQSDILKFAETPHDWKRMRKIIIDYQDVVKLSEEMKAVLGPPFAVQNATGAVLLTLISYNIRHNLRDNLMLISVNIFAVLALATVMFTCCFVGETLQTESNKVYESFCRLPYDDMCPRMRRTLSFMILVSRKTMSINFKNKLTLSLMTFQEIMNSSYTYFMLLNSMS